MKVRFFLETHFPRRETLKHSYGFGGICVRCEMDSRRIVNPLPSGEIVQFYPDAHYSYLEYGSSWNDFLLKDSLWSFLVGKLAEWLLQRLAKPWVASLPCGFKSYTFRKTLIQDRKENVTYTSTCRGSVMEDSPNGMATVLKTVGETCRRSTRLSSALSIR